MRDEPDESVFQAQFLLRKAEKPEAIAAAFEKQRKAHSWLVQSTPNAVFEIDEETGTGTGRVTIVEQYQRSKGGSGSLVGVYHDSYVRRDHRWLFAGRRLEVIHQSK